MRKIAFLSTVFMLALVIASGSFANVARAEKFADFTMMDLKQNLSDEYVKAETSDISDEVETAPSVDEAIFDTGTTLNSWLFTCKEVAKAPWGDSYVTHYGSNTNNSGTYSTGSGWTYTTSCRDNTTFY